MKKIPTLYKRDTGDLKHVLMGQINPGCEWVLAGEGIPTRKFDGTCILYEKDGTFWARREVKPGKTPPPAFRLISVDPNTGKSIGWEPAYQSSFAKYLEEAIKNDWSKKLGQTYELVGQKINGNPENVSHHELIEHGSISFPNDCNPEFLMEMCRSNGFDGIVWHHPDGRMAKLKVRDIP